MWWRIDEAQFFDDQVSVARTAGHAGDTVIVAGLDMDYLGNPFGQMPNLLAKADYITKLRDPPVCGNIANVSYRKINEGGQVLLRKGCI